LGKILLSFSNPCFLFLCCAILENTFLSSFVFQSTNYSIFAGLPEVLLDFCGESYCLIPTQLSPRKFRVSFCAWIVLISPIFSLLSRILVVGLAIF
jgi:hypothetical protein